MFPPEDIEELTAKAEPDVDVNPELEADTEDSDSFIRSDISEAENETTEVNSRRIRHYK